MLHQAFYGPPEMGGMAELMDIASGVSSRRLAALRREAGGSLTGLAANFPMLQLRGLTGRRAR